MEWLFQTCNSYGFGWKFHIIEKLHLFFVFLKKNTPDIKHHVGKDHSNCRITIPASPPGVYPAVEFRRRDLGAKSLMEHKTTI